MDDKPLILFYILYIQINRRDNSWLDWQVTKRTFKSLCAMLFRDSNSNDLHDEDLVRNTHKKTASRSKFVTIEIVCLVSLTISSTAQKLWRVIIKNTFFVQNWSTDISDKKWPRPFRCDWPEGRQSTHWMTLVSFQPTKPTIYVWGTGWITNLDYFANRIKQDVIIAFPRGIKPCSFYGLIDTIFFSW